MLEVGSPDFLDSVERRQSLLQAMSSLRELERRRCEADFGFFARQAWPTIEPGTEYIHGYHVEAIVDHLCACLPRVSEVERIGIGGHPMKVNIYEPGQIRKLLITMPPRHMKSTLVSVLFPAWVWTFRPELRFLSASYALSLAVRDAMKMRAVVMSPWYQSLWGDKFRMLIDQNSKDKFYNNKMGYRMTTSPDAAATGEGGDLVTVDDAHNVAEADSRARRDHTKTWWFESMGSRGNNPKTVAHAVVMQRVHQDDLPAACIERGYVHLNLPARYDPKRHCVTVLGWEDWRKDEGELLWPARFDEPTMVELETTLGAFGVASQLQQDPKPRGGAFIKEEWFNKRITPEELSYVGEIVWVRSFDLALVAIGDQVASLNLGAGPDGTLYCRGILAWNADWNVSRARIKTVGEAHRGFVHVEAIGTTKSAGEQVAEDLMGSCLVEKLESKRDKVSTAIPWIAKLAAGQIVFVEETEESFPLSFYNKVPGLSALISQCTSWKADPTIEQADDLIDAMTLAYMRLQKALPFLATSLPEGVSIPSAFDRPSPTPLLPSSSGPTEDFREDDDGEGYDDFEPDNYR